MASAMKNAPCVRAVKVDYSTGTATIGTDAGTPVKRQEIIDALAATNYRVEFIEQPAVKDYTFIFHFFLYKKGPSSSLSNHR